MYIRAPFWYQFFRVAVLESYTYVLEPATGNVSCCAKKIDSLWIRWWLSITLRQSQTWFPIIGLCSFQRFRTWHYLVARMSSGHQNSRKGPKRLQREGSESPSSAVTLNALKILSQTKLRQNLQLWQNPLLRFFALAKILSVRQTFSNDKEINVLWYWNAFCQISEMIEIFQCIVVQLYISGRRSHAKRPKQRDSDDP